MGVADVPWAPARRLDMKYGDVNFLRAARPFVSFEPRPPLERLVIGIPIVLHRLRHEVLDPAVFDRLEGLQQRLFAPFILLGALALDLDLGLGLVLRLLG